MREFAFELALCAHLEADFEGLVSRQLGASLHGNRVMDIVCIEPGPAFDTRTRITSEEFPIPPSKAASVWARRGTGKTHSTAIQNARGA